MSLKILHKSINDLYTAMILPDDWTGQTLIYVHGGPGSHCGDFEAGLTRFKELTSLGTAWLVYDQRGCGRSTSRRAGRLSHRQNIDDLKQLIATAPSAYNSPQMRIALYGHSYGARLVYDTLYTSPELILPAVIAGRSIHPLDAMNTSILIDIMILRQIDNGGFRKAQSIISNHLGEPFERAKQVRECFPDPVQRQKLRQCYYWINQEALEWWNSCSTIGLQDSDEVYFQVASTYEDEQFNSGLFDPNLLSQPMLLIQGFFDVLMNGTANPRLEGNGCAIKFNGSAHYPHFEQPELFMNTIRSFLEGTSI